MEVFFQHGIIIIPLYWYLIIMPLNASLKATFTIWTVLKKYELHYLFCYKHIFNSTFFFPKSFESAGGIKCDTQNGHGTEAKFITTALGHNSKALQNNADPYHLQD